MDRFDCFVVFAEMRTGSNFLEENLNALDGVTCHGEAFNPHFVGYPHLDDLMGLTLADRDADPLNMLERLKGAPGALNGFRYFHDHDARVLDHVLDDPRCAKVILTRNALDSYVSWKIAQETGQWKLTNVTRRKAALPRFDAAEFAGHLDRLQGFQRMLMRRLQVSGQSAFYIDYDDLQSLEVMNGLAAWLGVSARLDALTNKLKRQNPEPATSKVENPEDMRVAVASIDPFNLSRTPNFEPRRPPAVPSYVTARDAPLIFLPVPGVAQPRVENWLAALDGCARTDLGRDLNQKALRAWKSRHRGFKSFTVITHPIERAHRTFCEKILHPDGYRRLRETLRRRHGLPIPETADMDGYDRNAHRAAFAAFLMFLKANLNGQTSLRVDARWCSQTTVLRGFGQLVLPDHILREGDIARNLPNLARHVGRHSVPAVSPAALDTPFTLSEIYDADLERMAQEAYHLDYAMFGFGAWSDQAA